MHELTGPDDAKRMVDYWAAEGMTSYKAYMNITREELAVAIQQAHAHKRKLTGHLCSVTWPEAVALGIDDLEHGPVFADTEFVADNAPGRPKLQRRTLDAMSAESAQSYLTARANVPLDSPMTALLRKEMDFEVAFVKAGGLLLAGAGPTRKGGGVPGFRGPRGKKEPVGTGGAPPEGTHIPPAEGAVDLIPPQRNMNP